MIEISKNRVHLTDTSWTLPAKYCNGIKIL